MCPSDRLRQLALWPTLGQAWHARCAGTELALLFDGVGHTASELHARIAATAAQLQVGAGMQAVRPGDRVVLLMDNGVHFLVAFFACQWLGAVPVPLSPRSPAQRLVRLVADCNAACILVAPDWSQRARAVHVGHAYTRLFATLYDDALAVGAADPPQLWQAAPTDCAFIQYTSGSSGEAKGVMISHAAVLTNIQSFCSTLRPGQGDVFSSFLPLFHDMGLVCFGLAPLLLGLPLVLYRADALSLRAWMQGVAAHRVTLTGAPDTMLQLALRVLPTEEAFDLSTLRVLICGSEPVRHATLRQFGARYQVREAIKPAYGMAELTLCATLTAPHQALRVDRDGQVASGCAIAGVEVRIVPECSGAAAGEIRVRSPAVMMGYWGRPEASAQAIDAQGFLRTGDVGYLDAEGFLFVLGRHKNMLIRGGEKYSPHDLEAAALAQPEVRRVAVVQTQDTQATLLCVMEADRRLLAEPDALRALSRRVRKAAQTLAGLTPDVCCFVAAGSLPSTENGKLQHAKLCHLIERGLLPVVWRDVPEHRDVATLV